LFAEGEEGAGCEVALAVDDGDDFMGLYVMREIVLDYLIDFGD
jgi:hypothetical protein